MVIRDLLPQLLNLFRPPACPSGLHTPGLGRSNVIRPLKSNSLSLPPTSTCPAKLPLQLLCRLLSAPLGFFTHSIHTSRPRPGCTVVPSTHQWGGSHPLLGPLPSPPDPLPSPQSGPGALEVSKGVMVCPAWLATRRGQGWLWPGQRGKRRRRGGGWGHAANKPVVG